jgi:hypothetical protein
MSAVTSQPLRFTLDTNCVIHAAQHGQYATEVANLVTIAQTGAIDIFLTGAFELDQEKAQTQNLVQNLEWLQARPVVTRVVQPWRFNFSPIGNPGHGLVADAKQQALIKKLESIMLSAHLRPGQFDPETEPDLQEKFRRKVADVQHLGGHLMSNNDYFVTTDSDDMLSERKKARIFEASSIQVIDPIEALQIARQSR